MLVSAVVFLVKIYVQCGLVDAVLLLYRFFIRFHKIEPVKDAIGQDEARKELKLCRCVVFHTSKVRSFDTQTYLQVYVYVTLCHGSLQVSQKFKVYLDLLRQWRNDEAHLSPNATDEEVNAALKIVTSMYMFVVGNNITDLEMAGAL